jgi:hypothetical protein
VIFSGDGLTERPTSQGTVFLPNGGSSLYRLPIGTILYVQKIKVPILGG